MVSSAVMKITGSIDGHGRLRGKSRDAARFCERLVTKIRDGWGRNLRVWGSGSIFAVSSQFLRRRPLPMLVTPNNGLTTTDCLGVDHG
jgi:hypothetical protein